MTRTITSLFPDEAEARRLLSGPDSVTWRFGSDPRLYLVPLCPLILQVAHPTVGAGVRDFSDFEARPWDRLLRTLDWVTLLIYGGDEAIAAGRRLRALHKGFTGTREDGRPYYALEPDAYAWVHATLIHSYVAGHERYGRPMTSEQRERFYSEYRGLGRLVGVRERDLPDSWAGFLRYFDEIVDGTLTRTSEVDHVLHAVMGAPPPPLPMPAAAWRGLRLPAQRAVWLGGIGMLPERLRPRLGIRWTERDERLARALARASRASTPLLPGPLRILGPAQLRLRRRAIARGPLGAASA
jgi:uncharacterized protein (DUF2236 family)